MAHERESGAVVVDPLGGLLLDPPNELKFKGPFDDYVTVALSIRNPTEKRIAFKIKTTAPKRYCVKPNSGVLDPAQSMKVNVLLQPFNYDPNEKNKHKFMVQYMYLNESEMSLTVNDILNMWKDVPPTRLLDLKLKCLFEFTEAEQQRLSQLTPQSNESVSIQSSKSNTTASGMASSALPASQYSTVSSQQSVEAVSGASSTQPASKAAAAVSKTSKPNAAAAAVAANNSTADYSINDSTAVSAGGNDFESFNRTQVNTSKSSNSTAAATAAAAAAAAAAKTDKNDNLVNELKLVKKENEILKKEVSRLKEEETRLRKLALQSGSGSSGIARSGKAAQETASLDDLLNNRLLILVFVLVAIIFYLLLFR